MIMVTIVGGIITAWVFGTKILKLPSKVSILIGIGNSICGNSAVAAAATTIKATPEQVATVIGISALVGASQIIFLPLLFPITGLSFTEYGLLTGLSVYAVAQVIAVSFSVSSLSGEVATIIKMVRVMLLGPVLLALNVPYREKGPKIQTLTKINTYIPWFIAGFIIFSVLRTALIVPDLYSDVLMQISKFLFIISMAGIGLEINLREIWKIGPRVATTTVTTMGFMITASVCNIVLFRIL